MTQRADFPCAKTAAVLALHLDGDLDGTADDTHGYAFVDAATLHDHLRECASCQATLRRARRLDAALANGAGAAVSAHQRRPGATLRELEVRWFAGAAATAAGGRTAAGVATAGTTAGTTAVTSADARAAAASTASLVWMRIAAMATLAAAAVLVWTFAGGGGPVATFLPAPAPIIVRAAPPAPAPPPCAAPLAQLEAAPDSVRQLQQRRTATAENPAAATAGPVAAAPAIAHAAAAVRVADPACTATQRIAATTALLDACRAGGPAAEPALRQLAGALAACGDAGTSTALHARQLELLREARPARPLLAVWLQQLDAAGTRLACDDLAAIVVATRLGMPEFDSALRRLARRHDEVGEFVAAGLRCGVRTHGGARLLLDLWQDADARRDGGAAAAVPPPWFAAQPDCMFTELIAELRTCRAGARRLRCLLALGAAGDDVSLATLLECAQSRHHDEAVAAAFALSCLPHGVLDAIVPLAAADEAWLLRAALARARHEAARPWVDAIALRTPDRQRMFDADLARFASVAVWFRERGNSGD